MLVSNGVHPSLSPGQWKHRARTSGCHILLTCDRVAESYYRQAGWPLKSPAKGVTAPAQLQPGQSFLIAPRSGAVRVLRVPVAGNWAAGDTLEGYVAELPERSQRAGQESRATAKGGENPLAQSVARLIGRYLSNFKCVCVCLFVMVYSFWLRSLQLYPGCSFFPLRPIVPALSARFWVRGVFLSSFGLTEPCDLCRLHSCI